MFRFKNRNLTTYFQCTVDAYTVPGGEVAGCSISLSFIYVIDECYIFLCSMLHVVFCHMFYVCFYCFSKEDNTHYSQLTWKWMPGVNRVWTVIIVDYG